MGKKLLFIVVLLVFFSNLFAQKGDYFLSHHVPPEDRFDNLNFDIVQGDNGLMWIANHLGIIEYDGRNWQLIPATSAVLSITSHNDIIYFGGRNIVGKIKGKGGDYLFIEILKGPEVDDIFSIIAFEDQIFYLSEHQLFLYDPATDFISKVITDDLHSFLDIFEYQNNLVITTESGELLQLSEENTSLKSLQINGIDESISWLAVNPDGVYALLTDPGSLWLIKNNESEKLEIEDDGYLSNSIPLEVVWVTENLLAVSTLSGGVVFVDLLKKDEIQIVNYYTGLPANQVFTLATDTDEGVWIAHEYGLTRVMPLLPIRNYSRIPGIEGNILSIINYNNKIYAGTTVGVFLLSEVRSYNETITYQKKETAPGDVEIPEVVAETKNKKNRNKNKKRLFSFLNKKKSEPVPVPTTTQKFTWKKQVKQELQSVKYVFRKIDGISTRTELFVSLPNSLMAGSLSGIYEIKDSVANEISDYPVRYLHYSTSDGILFASTYDDKILTYNKNGDKWIESDILDGLDDIVYQITESEGKIWLSGADSIYSIEFERGYVSDVDVFKIENPYLDNTYTVNHNDEILFVNNSGYSIYDSEKRSIRKDSILSNLYGNPQRIFVGNDRSIWVFNGKKWFIFGAQHQTEKLDFLNAFSNIRKLDYSPDDTTYWIVTYNNDIYGVSNPSDAKLTHNYGVFLKEFRNMDKALSTESVLDLQIDETSLSFTFIQPEYSGLMEIEYRYRLTGLTGQWTEWSVSNNKVNFSFLPPGNYALELETKDIFGEISRHDPVPFNIVPPYWRQPWFYAFEVGFFTLLLLVSIRLNRSSSNYGVLSRLLAFLTLILIVEFVQTIAEYKFETDNSPVIDFFIQVSIALLVLPVEGLLRKAIFKERAINALRKEEIKTKDDKSQITE